MQNHEPQSISEERLLELSYYFSDGNLRKHLAANLETIRKQRLEEIGIKHGRIHIIVSVPSNRQEPKEVYFTITIGRQYPVEDVRLYLSTSITQVRVNDLRDHIEVAMGRDWHHQMKLKDVCDKLKDYVVLLSDISDQPVLLQKTGRYHLGEVFYVNMLKEELSIELLEASEKVNGKSTKRYLYVSETHFVVLGVIAERHKSPTERVYIHQYMTLQSVGELVLDREKSVMTVKMRKYRMVKGFTEYEWEQHKYTLKDFNGLLRAILKNMFKCQRVWSDFEPSKALEGNLKNYLSTMKLLEKEHQQHHSLKTSGQLGDIYHKLLEWHSKRGDSVYLLYVQKIKMLHSPVEP